MGWKRSGSARPLFALLTLLPERMAKQACGDSWRNIRNWLERIQLAQPLSGETMV